MIILGPSDITVVSLVDGSILATHSFPCLSTQPLTSGDINNDGTEEFLVRCEDRLVHWKEFVNVFRKVCAETSFLYRKLYFILHRLSVTQLSGPTID